MKRRRILAACAVAAAIVPALAGPALAIDDTRGRCASSFFRTIDTIFSGARVAAMTDSKFPIQVFQAAELEPEPAALGAMQAGTVDCTHTASHYFSGKEPISAFDGTIETIAKNDAQNPPALRRLVADGAQLRPFPRPVIEACYRATFELHDETGGRNPVFKTVDDHFRAYRDTQPHRFRVAEGPYDNFVYRMRAAETAEVSRR